MFTGIVEEIGIVKSFDRNTNGANLIIECKKILTDIKIGDSICIDGVCETVTKFDNTSFSVNISDETLLVTTFSKLKTGQELNLERALTLTTRLGGHIVSGHIDCKAKLISIEQLSDFYNMEFELEQNFSKYIVYKGSITVNGISLTVSYIKNQKFKVAIIPHTYNNTNLKNINIGSYVNIETDIIGRYIEKLLSANNNVSKESQISMDFLKENGFV